MKKPLATANPHPEQRERKRGSAVKLVFRSSDSSSLSLSFVAGANPRQRSINHQNQIHRSMKTKNKITSHCKQLRLSAIGEQVHSLADTAAAEGISYLEFAERLLETEIVQRNQNDMLRKVKSAKLPATHELHAYDCGQTEGMPPAKLQQLKELTWLDQNFNLVVMGPNGVGKSFLAAGLCHHALQSGYRAYFRTMEQIMTILKTKDISRSAMADYKKLQKAHLIVIDDIMMIAIARQDANAFFHFVNALHEKTSFIITTNKSPKEWAETIGDEVITTALLDRLLYRCEIIKLSGESYRMKNRKTIFGKTV
jgi:DNA replication protein DnaC